MRVPRLHVETPLAADATASLGERAARHIRVVLRLRPGDAVILFDGRGGEWRGELTALTRDRASARILSRVEIEREAALSVTLGLGVARGERMDWSVQKAVELGAAGIVPVFTHRSVVRLRGDKIERRREHWQAIAVSACEQCGRNRIPAVQPPVPIDQWLAALDRTGTRYVASPGAARGLSDLAPPRSGQCTMLVGPEGGLTDVELGLATDRDFEPVRLGPRVLRTETAAITMLAAAMTLWGDIG